MTKDQMERLRKYQSAPFQCTETCGKYYTDREDFEVHVVDCRHIFPEVRAALRRLRERGLPVVAIHKPPRIAPQPELFPSARTHHK